ncbi:MAG: hypothetical protein VX938_14165, partial [Myxococcota bacterium]|nr:hypothetical protein [Myxococcota bacterium]
MFLALSFGACSSDDDPAPAPVAPADATSGDSDATSGDSDATSADPDATTVDPGPDGTSVDPDASTDPVDGSVEEPAEPIGNETGDPVSLDHATAFGAVEANIVKHVDGLEAALKFLEDSDSVNNVVEMLFGDDDDEDEDEDEGPAEEEDEGLEIDLEELRDDIVELIADNLMVESTATEADDGLSLTYELDPKILCDEDPEEEESEEMKLEREEDEADCEARMGDNPIRIVVTSDGDHRMDLSVRAGADDVEVLVIQVHDDMMSVTGNLPHAQTMLQAFVDPDDFTLPETMEGKFACEVREDAALVYTVRCSVLEAINAQPGEDQEPISVQLSQMDEPVKLTLDGAAATIDGALTSEAVDASVPWQWIVDMFWDDEGYSEWVCEPNGDGGENCYDKWIEPPESPEVDNAFIVALPGVAGALGYAASDDTFRLMDVHLGGATTTVKVDADTIVSFDLSPES